MQKRNANCGKALDDPPGRDRIPTPDAGWSSPVAREAHNLEVAGSNPVPAICSKYSRSKNLRYLPMVGSAAKSQIESA